MKYLLIALLLAGCIPARSFAQNKLSDSTCSYLFGLGEELEGEGPSAEPAGYDTLRLFLEQCPLWGKPHIDAEYSIQGLIFINGCVSEWAAGGAGRWPDFLAFLKQILYLNPDTGWYCQDVDDMITAEQKDETTKLAELKYLIENNRCPEFTSDFQTLYSAASRGRYTAWLDSIKLHYEYLDNSPAGKIAMNDSINADTLAHPYDTTIPSLQQVGLEILLGPENGGAQSETPVSSQALLSAQLLDNPVSNEIGVKFQMGRTALVTMELQDVLGRSIPLQYAKYQLTQPGSHTAYIPDPNLPSGTYYLRISTDVGDVITLKLVKQ